MTTHKWQFASRFRRHAFGWRSDTPVQRIKEALAEIKAVARKDPVLAAEGAVTLLEKLSPALEQVDSSSGALGTAVNRAIDTLVPIIAKADVDRRVRQRWLERLWQALQDDQIPYIESLGEHWGELCGTPELAVVWVDELLPLVEHVWSPLPARPAPKASGSRPPRTPDCSTSLSSWRPPALPIRARWPERPETLLRASLSLQSLPALLRCGGSRSGTASRSPVPMCSTPTRPS